MSESAKKDYQVTTNVKALAKVSEILKAINIDDIPILDFSEKETEEFVVFIELQLSNDIGKFNSFFQTITQTRDDFSEDIEVAHKLAVDFFEKLPSGFLKIIKKSIIELKKQKDMVIQKNQKMMEQTIKEMFEKEMKERIKDIT